ncbi:MAG TPA: tyrosine-type recombinase/integrase [Micromonosporaceae bacterium]
MGSQLLDLHLDHLMASGKSDKTIEVRRSVLRRLHDRLPFGLAYAATEQILAWFADLRAHGRSRWTLSIYQYHVTSFYRWATGAGFLDGDPARGIDRITAPRCVPDPVTDEELAAALLLPDPWRSVVALAAYAGMRCSEVAACHRNHITAERIMIPHGKGDKPGSVPTHPYLWELLEPRSGLIVTNREGEPVSGNWVSRRTRAKLAKAGLKGVHPHRFRHWYGTTIQASTGDIRVTQELMRHSSISSTMGYTLVTGAARTAAVSALPVPDTAAPAR